MKTIIKITASCFYLGYIPFIPGTIGSLVGLLIYLIIQPFTWVYSLVLFSILVLGFLVSEKAESIFGCKDSPKIIIDEIAGMLISLYLLPLRPQIILIGFFLFRLLDIVKPYPARALEKQSRGRGVMLDDIVSATYTNFVLQIVFRLAI